MATLFNKVMETIIREKRSRPRGWDRTEVVRFFVNKSGFRSLPAYSGDMLSAEGKARNSLKGWEVPAEAFNRSPDVSQRNSLRAYIEDVVIPAMASNGDNGVTIDKVAIHLDGWGDDVRVMIYRKG